MIYLAGDIVRLEKKKIVRMGPNMRGYTVDTEFVVGLVVERLKYLGEEIDRYMVLSDDGEMYDVHVGQIRIWQDDDDA